VGINKKRGGIGRLWIEKSYRRLQATAKNIKTEADLNEFRQMLTKMTVETALNVELDDHLGFSKYERSETDNNRNGFTSKTLQIEDGQFELNTA